MITNEQIKNLREITGVSIMQCKKALEESKGDTEKAILILRKKSGDIAAKKKDRVLGAGAIAAYIHNNASVGALVELLSETDFVSGNEEFRQIAHDLAMHITAANPEFLARADVSENEVKKVTELFTDEIKGKPATISGKILKGKIDAHFKERVLLEQAFIKNPDLTIQGLLDGAIQKFGEKITISRFARFSVK
ncbi:MAG: elongation factor T [Parcubacteria group bacterium Gr01-1014_73]|nr:MAG: elongation factor T [Parcubacteria group bacterium Gr01-1014_73]